jgi:putative acetyltransferase
MIRLRPFTPDDEDALRAVFTSAVREVACRDYTPAQIDAWAPLEWDAEDLAEWTERMRSLQPFVAELDGRVAGYADLQADGYIDHFFVAGAAGRQGVGGALMRHILARAEARGLAGLSSHVSLTAQPFYAHFGFEIVEQCRPVLSGVELSNALMRKTLRPAPE